MLSQLFMKRGTTALLSKRITGVRYFALNKEHLALANKDPQHNDWNKFFSSFPASDVAGSDNESITQLLRALSFSSESDAAKQPRDLYNAIDEHFRQNFRKMTGQQALQILMALGEDNHQSLSMLDDKFWVWETLDEAMRPIAEDLNEAQVLQVTKALAANYKGSEDLWDYLVKKIHFYGATPY